MLHVLNHVLTSRGRIQRHNKKLKDIEDQAKEAEDESKLEENEDEDQFRDQGFTRPTVLVLLPTRSTVHTFVHHLIKMLKTEVQKPHMERFEADYGQISVDEDEAPLGVEQEKRRKAILKKKGKEWNELFGDEVNQDDDFKLGISLTPKTATGKKDKKSQSSNVGVKLYSDFYKSDIIVASPLGLKMLVQKGEDSENGDHDYLSSIEICLMEYADVMLMQNWDHVNYVLGLLNKQPEKNNSTDFSRVRNYFLDDQAAHYRQLIVSTKVVDPFLLNSFKRFGKSESGSVKMRRNVPPEDAAISKILVPMRQVFQKVSAPHPKDQGDSRVDFFVKNVLPKILEEKQKHTMIYIPSYFDFVTLRNIMLKRQLSFVSVTEYSRITEVSRGRARFLQGRKPIMLFTGRCNFFQHHAIKGIRHLIFLGLPEHPDFYADQVNLINTSTDDLEPGEPVPSCLVLFTRYEAHALERIVATDNCSRMLRSEKNAFMFYS
jgi:U3 small nucleolar RNA-associated protein 25